MTIAVLLAAGKSTRAHRDKLTTVINGQPLLVHTCMPFQRHVQVDRIVIVTASNKRAVTQKIIRNAGVHKCMNIIAGGTRRQASVAAAMQFLLPSLKKSDVVLFHNGANPFVTAKEISAVISAVQKNQAAGVGRPLTSTVKQMCGGRILKTLPRADLISMETPQGLRGDLIARCLKKALSKTEYTDDLALAEACGIHPVIVPASDKNRKITTDTNLQNAAVYLTGHHPDWHVGFGVDSHRFMNNGTHSGVLGGVSIPTMLKVSAESDGDVVLHALATALSQALGGGSLGTFAKSSPTKKCDSAIYVKTMLQKIRLKKMRITHVGIMIECATPQIDPLTEKMRQKISQLIGLQPECIGITATSGEKLTPWGKGEGIQCTAVVSLVPA